jgi:hypothetical protein
MEDPVKLIHARMTDVKSIIKLQALLDRPLPNDKHEIKKFRNLPKIIFDIRIAAASS